MVPSLVCFIIFDKDDFDTQKLQDRSLSQEIVNVLRSSEEKDKKILEQEIEIVELAQTSKISPRNSDSRNSLVVNNNNYWQSLKTIMRSKVM